MVFRGVAILVAIGVDFTKAEAVDEAMVRAVATDAAALARMEEV